MEKKIRTGSTMTVRIDRGQSERGQILPLLVLTMATMAVAAMVAITFGQSLVRRQQAQMVVDAAAFAGASEQAKALNTIARLNEKSYSILNGIVLSQKESFYMDDDSTTWGRILEYGITNDWAEDNWESFQGAVFDRIDRAINAINFAYRPYGIPMRSAQRVVEENFGSSDRLFHGEAAPNTPSEWEVVPSEQGPVVWWEDIGDARSQLVKLTARSEYAVGGERVYVPYFDNWAVTCDPFYGLNVPCDLAKGALYTAYVEVAPLIFNAKALTGSHPTYELGRFYPNDPSSEVRFTYYLKVPSASPIIAKSFLSAIPPIEVVASAKPYHGHLGVEFLSTRSWLPPDPTGLFWVGLFEQSDRTPIQMSYVAKLTTVRAFEKKQLALWNFNDDYFSIMH